MMRFNLRKDSPGISGREVVALLDAAGIERALVLSMAYTWGKARREPADGNFRFGPLLLGKP